MIGSGNKTPTPDDPAGVWNGWLTKPAANGDADEVRRRIDEVPDPIRDEVLSHARTVWALAHRKSKNPR